MTKTLRESKAKLSELVERASRGEDVVITVRGKAKARLTAVRPASETNRGEWIRELRTLRGRYAGRRRKTSTDQVLAELREDHV